MGRCRSGEGEGYELVAVPPLSDGELIRLRREVAEETLAWLASRALELEDWLRLRHAEDARKGLYGDGDVARGG